MVEAREEKRAGEGGPHWGNQRGGVQTPAREFYGVERGPSPSHFAFPLFASSSAAFCNASLIAGSFELSSSM